MLDISYQWVDGARKLIPSDVHNSILACLGGKCPPVFDGRPCGRVEVVGISREIATISLSFITSIYLFDLPAISHFFTFD